MTARQYEIILRKKHEIIAVPGISLQELSRMCSCRIAVARRLLDIGLLESLTPDGLPTFEQGAVIRARKALRLKHDLNLNFDAVALVMELLDRIDELERSRMR